jgi:hypothetical protein
MALGAMGLGFCPAHAAQLSLAAPATSTQSSDLTGGTTSIRALDGNTGSYSATLDASNSFWEVELPRTYWMTRIEVVAPSAVTLSNVCSGLTFTLHDLRDRLTFTSTVTNPGLGGTWGIDLPPRHPRADAALRPLASPDQRQRHARGGAGRGAGLRRPGLRGRPSARRHLRRSHPVHHLGRRRPPGRGRQPLHLQPHRHQHAQRLLAVHAGSAARAAPRGADQSPRHRGRPLAGPHPARAG